MDLFKISNAKNPEGGFNLIELIFCLGILSVVMLAITSMSVHLTESVTTNATRSELHVFRQNLVALIMSDAAWRKTTKINGWSCLTEPPTKKSVNPWCSIWPEYCASSGACKNVGPSNATSFALYDGAGNLFYDSTNAANGVTAEGLRCGPHANLDALKDQAYPSKACPHSYQVQWFATTSSGGPTVGIVLTLKSGYQKSKTGAKNVSDFEKLSVNYARYSMPTMFRSPQ